MEYLNFFTPVRYEGPCGLKQRLQEAVEGYFHLGGRSAYVVPGYSIGRSQRVVLKEKQTNVLLQVVYVAIKIFSYLTVVIPAALFLAKIVFRRTHQFHTTDIEDRLNQIHRAVLAGANKEGTYKDNSLSVLSFYSIEQQITFWECYLDTFFSAVDDDEWDTPQGLPFLKDDIFAIRETLSKLKDAEMQSKKKIEGLIHRIDKSLKVLERKLHDLKWNVKGIRNRPGENLCWLNAALQPLLAIANFEALVPKEVSPEPADSKEKRQKILNSFKEFLGIWKRAKDPAELGKSVGELRKTIFAAELEYGALKGNLTAMHDSRSFFELILHVLGRGFELEKIRTPLMEDGRDLVGQEKVERWPMEVMILKCPGSSIQEKLKGHLGRQEGVFDKGNEWRKTHPETGAPISISRFYETEQIVGEIPEILVVKVDPHGVVPERDCIVDFKPLFKTPPENSRYELAGFLQNHGEIHYTAVVYKGGKWVYCNDSHVEPTTPSDPHFKCPANYMVYRRIKDSLK